MVWIYLFDSNGKGYGYNYPTLVEARKEALGLLRGSYGKRRSGIYFFKNKNSDTPIGSVWYDMGRNTAEWHKYNKADSNESRYFRNVIHELKSDGTLGRMIK